ncbi:MAG: tRNA (guanine-N1)-methyltransferase [Flavobacteriaceae bacterium]|nr:tRNA (guanine-N1)-methyltransferase [Flavobacteriaceae bacterium]
MKKNIRKFIVVSVLLACSFNAFSQQKDFRAINKLPVPEQFEYMYKKAGKYKHYKVIEAEWFYMLKKNVTDSIKSFQKRLIESKKTIEEQALKIEKTNSELKEASGKIDNLSNEKESISFLGIPLKKAMYNIVMFLIIGALSALLVFYIYRFRGSHQITKKYKKDLSELEKEFEEHRAKALEREQKVRRELQDLINQKGA